MFNPSFTCFDNLRLGHVIMLFGQLMRVGNFLASPVAKQVSPASDAGHDVLQVIKVVLLHTQVKIKLVNHVGDDRLGSMLFNTSQALPFEDFDDNGVCWLTLLGMNTCRCDVHCLPLERLFEQIFRHGATTDIGGTDHQNAEHL